MRFVQTSGQDLNFAFIWNSYVTHIRVISKSYRYVSVRVYGILLMSVNFVNLTLKFKKCSLSMDFTELISQGKLAKAYWTNFSSSKPNIVHFVLCYWHRTSQSLTIWRFPEDRNMTRSRQPSFSLLLIGIDCAYRSAVALWLFIWSKALSFFPNRVQDEMY